MLVVVCGSRTWTDRTAIHERLALLEPADVVLTGGAPGADRIAARVAAELGLRTECISADWDRLGRKAGILRNLEMLERKPELVIAYWDGASRGTAHMVRAAARRGITVETWMPVSL